MDVAVIGGGAAGMGAAWGLTKAGFRVTLLESEGKLGGQCLGAPVPLPDGGTAWVDVGVSDFNRATFTNVAALFDELGLEYRPICQDASFMHPGGGTAWYTTAGVIHPVDGFADEVRFKAEIARFRLECMEVLEDATFRNMRLADYCDLRDYSDEFRELYLYPRAQGSFPMPDCDPADYQTRGLIAFWRIHGIAGPGPADRNVLVGGMHHYGEAFAAWLAAQGGTVILNANVVGVARRGEGVRVRYVEQGGESRTLTAGQIVFAVRSNQVIPLLEDANEEEKRVYDGFLWQRARVVVHQDTALMPDRREAWGAYNYVLNEPGGPEIRPTITFYPNKLAGTGDTVPDTFVTMNPYREPDPARILMERFFIHPAAGASTDLACARIEQMQGLNNSWYAGSYLTRPWVHEQALATGVGVAELMLHRLREPGREAMPHVDDFLRSVPLFAGLDPYALADVQFAAERFAVPAGDYLFRQNDEADGLHLIVHGALRVVARTPGDAAIELARLGPGDMIGEFALIDGGRRSAGAEATEPTSGFFISRRRFEAMMASGRPTAFEVIDRVRAEVARRTRATIEDIAAAQADPGLLREAVVSGEAVDSGTDGMADVLRALGPFAALTAPEAATIAALCTRRDARRGSTLARGGDPPAQLFIVLRGAVRVVIERDCGVEQIAVYGPGAFAGLVAMMDGGAQPATLEVREDALLLAMERRNFEALRAGHSEAAFKLFEAIGRQLTGDLRRLSRHGGRGEGLDAFNRRETAHV